MLLGPNQSALSNEWSASASGTPLSSLSYPLSEIGTVEESSLQSQQMLLPTKPGHTEIQHRFRCERCDIPFLGKPKNAASNLKRHLEEIHRKPTEPISCPECGQRFTRMDNLRKHMQLKHKSTAEIIGYSSKRLSRNKKPSI